MKDAYSVVWVIALKQQFNENKQMRKIWNFYKQTNENDIYCVPY